MYRWFEQYVINYIVNFGKGFEQVFVMIAIITFLLLSVFLLIRQAKKLPKYYFIEIVDIFGRSIILDDLRVNFSTFDAAKSYSQFYSVLFGEQYETLHQGETTKIVELKKETEVLFLVFL